MFPSAKWSRADRETKNILYQQCLAEKTGQPLVGLGSGRGSSSLLMCRRHNMASEEAEKGSPVVEGLLVLGNIIILVRYP